MPSPAVTQPIEVDQGGSMESTGESKKVYSTPQLVVHGTVEAITAIKPAGDADVNGGIYTPF